MLTLLLVLADGQIATFDATSIMPAVSNLGALGFAVWYAYYCTTVAIPKLIEAHQKERTEMQERFDKTVHDLLGEMREQRELFSKRTIAS